MKAEGKREQGWTDLKAEAEKSVGDAVERADAASKAATKAIADVKATEAKLYPVAENVLKGTAKDTFIHVDDAFTSKLLGITVEGASKQDGTPSPDNPVPIQVVENPVFKVTGRNLLDFSFPAYYAVYSSGVAYIKYSYKEAALPFTTEINSANGFGFALKLKPGTYTLRAFNTPAKAAVAIAMYAEESKIYSQANKISYMKEGVLTAPISFTVSEGAEYVVICLAAEWGDGHNKITYPADFKVTVEYGTTASDYAPYTSQSQAFTLPAEHPYLAKLPDGTADEIAVDQEGNVELVARVAHGMLANCTAISDSASQRGADGSMNYLLGIRGSADFKIVNGASCFCNRFRDGGLTKNADTIRRGANDANCYIYTSDAAIIGDGTPQHVNEWLAANLTEIMYEVAEPTRYNLGKIEMPKTQDSIINTWTDAEVTPRTGIEYTRDVNIVVANLESAIASITEG